MICFTFSVDVNLNISSWDGNLEVIHKKTATEVLGAPYYDIFPRIWNGNEDAVSKVVREGKNLAFKGYRYHCFHGEIEGDISINPLFADGLKLIGAEITILIEKECSLLQELERFKSLIDIGKISATLAHGVRNPLNAIKGAVVYLKGKYESDVTFVEFVDIIDEEIVKLDSFITSFLSTSLMEMKKTRCDMNALLDKLVKLTSLQALSRNIHFSCEYGQIPPLELDTFHIENAILNVINNALEAISCNGSITLRTSIARNDGIDFAVVDISDSGPGVQGKEVGELMSSPDQKAWDRGKGFGLFITREVIQNHRGRIEITSEKGSGTTVRFWLPLEDSLEARDAG